MDCDTLHLDLSSLQCVRQTQTKAESSANSGLFKSMGVLVFYVYINKTTKDSIYRGRMKMLFVWHVPVMLGSITPVTRKREDGALHTVACGVMDVGGMKHYGK